MVRVGCSRSVVFGLVLFSVSLGRAQAAVITPSDYFPLVDDNSWTYIVDNSYSDTLRVLTGTTLVNGVATKGLEDSFGEILYATSDSNGVREHRDDDPSPPASSGVFSPPAVLVGPAPNMPDTFNSSGTATLSIPAISPTPFVLSYTTTSAVQAFETITVPAGTFKTVRVQLTLRIFGNVAGNPVDDTTTETYWVARFIGPVKIVSSDSEGTETRLLTSTTVVPPPVKDEIVIDFGGIGLWARMNDASWLKLNNSSPDLVVVGDIDGSDQGDIIADFGSTFGGIYIKHNMGAWVKLHNFSPELMAVGDLDGNGKDDVVIDFGGIGLWARMNDASWLKLNNSSPDLIAVGDVDGNGQDDVIADFTSTFGGIFVKRNLGGWSQLHGSSAEALATGDLDNNGKDDIVIDFGGIGLWARMNDASWLKLHNSSPDLIAAGDIDGNGAADVLATFAAAPGLWAKKNLGGWSSLSTATPEKVVTGDVDGNGTADIVADFGASGAVTGIFVRRNQAAWIKLHNSTSEGLAIGNLD
jgi:hypothetical protein